MKSLGTVRKVDELGRIVLPIETRRRLELEAGDGVEIFVEKDRVILKKYEPACLFCGDADDVMMYKDKRICRKCLMELKTEADNAVPLEDIE
ncbi:MAG: AbrB/MazE/SpoVT family DNA-binding domain-containing protein [Ruminococcaceae bacterium]|nr:AbrB/MazE/SpoVT family DNA-binding domain-containing protein [Oscillospiraceae bacterium]